MDPETPEPAAPVAGPYTAARALAAPTTWDAATGTLQVIWTTGARAVNFLPNIGAVLEELDMSPSAIRLGQLAAGNAPVLDNHRLYEGARSVVGRVVSASLEGSRGIATLQISSADDVTPIRQRLADGTLRNISAGYTVYRYEVITEGDRRIYRAVDWEPFEISLVAVPADAGATVRSAPDHVRSCAVEPAISHKEPKMETQTPAEAAAPAPAAAPVATPATHDPIAAERQRTESIYSQTRAAANLGLPAEQVEALRSRAVEGGWTPDAFGAELFRAAAARPAPVISSAHAEQTGPSRDDPTVVVDAMAEAIAVRSMPGTFKPSNERYREFMGWQPSDFAGELQRLREPKVNLRDRVAIAQRAFHTTSDFPLLLSASANKMLLAGYQIAGQTYRQFFLRRDFRDFKPHRHLRVGDFPNLLGLNENGEIQAGTISESQELVTLATYARRIRVTRQMLVNDDLGAFTDFASMIGRRTADFENATAYALVNTASGAGPTLATGAAAVFAAGRNNLAGAGTALDLTNLAAGRAAIMKQKTLDGLPISVGQQMRLVVGANLEVAARQLTVAVGATQVSNANVLAGFVAPVVDPQIPNNRWYLFAEPAAAPVYVYGYLNGAEGPQVTSGAVSGVDGVEVQVIFDFGVGAIDFRGGWFNPGT